MKKKRKQIPCGGLKHYPTNYPPDALFENISVLFALMKISFCNWFIDLHLSDGGLQVILHEGFWVNICKVELRCFSGSCRFLNISEISDLKL